jgi:UDP-N-acetylglucosamine--N-acetylmuramyl-(pentapeptide) pyrophosphoryl-undecaprenol N-acetylglucosamine transferase
MRLVIAGGGTGGHLFPGIAVAEEFLGRDEVNEVLFIGTQNGIEARVLPGLGYPLEFISVIGMRRKSLIEQVKGIIMLMKSYFQSKRLIKSFRPDIVLGVGGYASGPVVLAAMQSSCKRFIHEQNALPGLTNKFLAHFAEKVFISFEESERSFPAGKSVVTGNPLRRQILNDVQADGSDHADREEFRLLVFGGSAGAHSINMAMVDALSFLDDFKGRLSITHQTGINDLDEVKACYRKVGFDAEVLPFIHNMADEYHRADLVICRAGATTLAEVTACGKACIFIPFPFATDDHQRKNAQALVEKGAGFMLLNTDLTGEHLANMIRELMEDKEKLKIVGMCARKLARPDAAKIIVDEMLADGRQRLAAGS